MANILTWLAVFWDSLKSGTLPQLGHWNYLVLSLLVLIEGPFATLLGAAAASAGMLKLPYVIISCFSGNLIADTLWYLLGYSGRVEWALSLGRRFGLQEHHLELMKEEMVSHAGKVLFLAKMTAGFSIASLVTAGMARVSLVRWLPVVAGTGALSTLFLVLIGFFATEFIKQVEQGIHYAGYAFGLLFLVVVVWWFRRKHQRKNTGRSE